MFSQSDQQPVSLWLTYLFIVLGCDSLCQMEEGQIVTSCKGAHPTNVARSSGQKLFVAGCLYSWTRTERMQLISLMKL